METWQQTLSNLAEARLGDAHADWWAKHTQGAFDRVAFLAGFSGAGRRFGHDLVGLPEADSQVLSVQGLQVVDRPWSELGRVALLVLAGIRVGEDELVAMAEEAYRTGDLSEKQAVLRALFHLPAPRRMLAIAAEGARANALSIFEAIATTNPYPCAYFGDDTLNQMVMKALFNGVSLRNIVGLPARLNADLVRIARDYGNERRAAGRSISDDLAMLEGKGIS